MKKEFILLIIIMLGLSFLDLTIGARGVQAAVTEEIALVRQDCTGYDKCYTSLVDWEADFGGINFGSCSRGDLVCANKIALAKIDGVWSKADSKAVTLDGWITGVDNYIKVYTTSEARHKGIASSGYRLVVSDEVTTVVYIHNRQSYVRLEGLEIYSAGSAGSHGVFIESSIIGGGGEVWISQCLIHGNGTNTRNGIYNYDFLGTTKIWNNIIYDVAKNDYDAGIHAGSGTNYVYNNTVVDSIKGYGIKAGAKGAVLAYNNLVKMPNTANTAYDGVFNTSSDYNSSSDTTTTGGSSDATNKIYYFSNEVNDNFHLTSADYVAKDGGKDLSANTHLAFSDDINGETRSGLWDIGADEYSGAGISAYCGDGACNGTETCSTCSGDCGECPRDTTSPVCSDGEPKGSLPVGTTQTNLTLKTGEVATCKYSLMLGIEYSLMTDTFSSTGALEHSTTIKGLQNSQTYTYYIKCQDEAANANTNDYVVTFSVAPAELTPEPVPEPTPTPEPEASVTETPKPIPERPLFAYSKPRLSSLIEEQDKALELKTLLEQHYGRGKIPVARKHWPTIVNSYIYGSYPIKAVTQAIKFGGKTVHPTIPYEAWQNAKDYKDYIDK